MAIAIPMKEMEPGLTQNIDDSLCLVIDDNVSAALNWPKINATISGCLLPTVQSHDIQKFDIHFLHAKERLTDARTSREIQDLFDRVRPIGNSPISPVLSRLLRAYERMLLHPRSRWPQEDSQAMRPMHYFILTENLMSDDRRKLERLLVESQVHLKEQNFPAHQIRVCFFYTGWYNPFPREEFKVLRQNLHRLGVHNVLISLGPDSEHEAPESDDDLALRMVNALVELFSDNFGTSIASDNISNQLLDATSSGLPSPRRIAATKPGPLPETLVQPRETELINAIESPLTKEVSKAQAQEWSTSLRFIVAGKRRASDEDFSIAIDVLEEVYRLAPVLTKQVLQESGLGAIVNQLATDDSNPEALASRLWLRQKAEDLNQYWCKRFGKDYLEFGLSP